jgi:hypothetical protein
MTIGNILSSTRNKPSKHAAVLLALLPVPPKMLGVAVRDARQRQVNNEILCDLMEAIFAPMAALGNTGLEVECADGKVRLCFLRLSAWIADHLENVTLHGIQQNQCAVCEVRPEQLGSYLRRSAAKRDYRKSEHLFNKYCDNDQHAKQQLTDCGFKLLPSVFWGLPNVQQSDLPKPDILHVVYLGIFETHLMKWVIGFLKKYKRLQAFDAIWKSLDVYPGYSAPNKEYSRISQWTGKEMKNLVKVILPCFAASLRRPSAAERPIFTKALTCVRSIVDFTLMSQYTSHTDETIQYLERFLEAFHDHKDVFKEYRKDKSTTRKVREVTARIRGEHSVVLNQHRLWGATVAKRRRIADEQRRDLDGIVADIYDEDVDFNFVKMHLLSHFGDHIRRFGNIQMYSTESGETSHKTMIKEGYQRSNKNDASQQILQSYARLDSFKIHEMNIQADQSRPIQDEVRDKQQHKRQVGSVTKQPTGFTPTVETVSQFNQSLRNFPDLLIDYYRRKSSVGQHFEVDSIKQFPVEICRLLRVPVENFQDEREVTWHLLRCTGTQRWRSTGQNRNDWVWVDSGNRSIYGALKGCYPARLISIMKVRDLRTGLVDRLVLVDRLYVENSGKLSDITGLVTVTLGTGKGPNGTTEIVVGIKRIMGMAHLVPETTGTDNNRWYVNSRIDLETFNRIY